MLAVNICSLGKGKEPCYRNSCKKQAGSNDGKFHLEHMQSGELILYFL